MSAATPALVRVEKWKRPHGRVSHWDAYELAEDEHGLWLHSPKGSVHHLRRGDPWVAPWHGVQLIPSGGPWWVAWFWDDPRGRWCAADVCTPASTGDGVCRYTDLELDLVCDERGFRELVDQDEFDEAVGAGWIDEGEAVVAQAAASELQGAMTSRQEPFAGAGWRHLERGVAKALAPTI